MRAITMLAVACGCFGLSRDDALGQTRPITATVQTQAPFYGRAGEGEPPCGHLAAGSSVEIHRQEGAWMAVRPPVGSFSWVKADEVLATAQEGVVQVGGGGAQSWIGHQGTDLRAIAGVVLSAGEPLKVVGEATLISTGQPQKWYKIAPPSGEFRYLPAQYAASAAAADDGSTATQASVPAASQISWMARGSRDLKSVTMPVASGAAAHGAAIGTAGGAPAAVAVGPLQQPNVPPAILPSHVAAANATAPIAAPVSPNAEPAAANSTGIDPAGQRLDWIEKQMSAMIAHPPATWNTVPLAVELQALAATSPSPEARVRAGQLWAKVYECQQIQAAYAQISAAAAPSAALAPSASEGGNPMQAATSNTATPSAAPANAFVTPASYTPAGNANGPSSGPVQLTPEMRAMAPRNVFARLREAAANLRAASESEAQQAQQAAYGRQPQAAPPAAPHDLAAGSPPVSPQAMPHALPTPAAGGPAAIAPTPLPAADANFAGTGWLMPLVPRSQLPLDSRSGIPPYALTDDEGNVQFLVTPAPGMNLSQYLRQQVGVAGPASQLPNLASPHITAHRIVVLGRHE